MTTSCWRCRWGTALTAASPSTTDTDSLVIILVDLADRTQFPPVFKISKNVSEAAAVVPKILYPFNFRLEDASEHFAILHLRAWMCPCVKIVS